MKHVFLVGCPRSGTTWLQLLLAQHAEVATARETHLFNGYVKQIEWGWNYYRSKPDRVGLHTLLSDDEYYGLLSQFVRGVLDKVAQSNPAATVVLEKTPNHVRWASLILKVLPEAYFINIVRDPRSVVSSLCAASRSWGNRWASSDVLSNARLWCDDVQRGRQIGELTNRFQEVRYEDLRGSNGAAVLHGLFAGLGLSSDPGFAASAMEACEISRLQEGGAGIRNFDAVKPRNNVFFRKGTTDGWKQDLSPRDIRVVEYAAGALMQEYGYLPDRGATTTRPFRVLVRDVVDGIESRVRTQTDAAFKRLRAVC